MSTFRADLRTAAVTLLRAYGDDAGLRLQVYPGRPLSINPPTAFVDTIRESLSTTGTGSGLQQRRPQVDIVILHGLFDTADSVDQADRFVDGFVTWVKDRYHAAGANTLVEAVSITDVPNFVPDWQAPAIQRSYFGTRFTLEGLALT